MSYVLAAGAIASMIGASIDDGDWLLTVGLSLAVVGGCALLLQGAGVFQRLLNRSNMRLGMRIAAWAIMVWVWVMALPLFLVLAMADQVASLRSQNSDRIPARRE
jgi:hypothetical protein